MDSNNGPHHIGIGEREGKIISQMVHDRNFGLIHGIGRSGNINDLQPKAAGSSLLMQLTCSMMKNLLHSIGLSFISNLIILPFATGMALTLSFLTLRLQKPSAKYIIWSRIDQKTCFKCMITSGFTPVVIEPIQLEGEDELHTNSDEIKSKIDELGKENVLCVFTTTSCFAPRGYDNIEEIAKVCKEKDIFHVVNNAYGIYCTKVSDILCKADKKGKVDLIISSTDKNFMVPVGGAIIYSSNCNLVDKVKKNYPGRASAAPIIDIFISFLQMGKDKYIDMVKDRKIKYDKLKSKMSEIAKGYGERILENKNNKISIGMTLGNICSKDKIKGKKDVTEIGAMFYNRQISGIRIMAKSDNPNEICGYKFNNYGSSCENYKYLPYMTFACAIGITDEEIDGFVSKFTKIIDEYIKNHK